MTKTAAYRNWKRAITASKRATRNPALSYEEKLAKSLEVSAAYEAYQKVIKPWR